MKVVAGVKIGILGLTTPGVPYWDNPPNYAGLEFREPVAEARKWVATLRTQEKVDVVVIAMHMGLGEDLRTGEVSPGRYRTRTQPSRSRRKCRVLTSSSWAIRIATFLRFTSMECC